MKGTISFRNLRQENDRQWPLGFVHPLFADGEVTTESGAASATLRLNGSGTYPAEFDGRLRLRHPGGVLRRFTVLQQIADQLPELLRETLSPTQAELWGPLPQAFIRISRTGLRFEPLDLDLPIVRGRLVAPDGVTLVTQEGAYHLQGPEIPFGRGERRVTTEVASRLRARTREGATPLELLEVVFDVWLSGPGLRRPIRLEAEILR